MANYNPNDFCDPCRSNNDRCYARGPDGPPGTVGVILGEYPSLNTLQAAHPRGAGGNYYLIGKNLYAFDPYSNRWMDVGSIAGPPGPTGPTGLAPRIEVMPGGTWGVYGVDTGVPQSLTDTEIRIRQLRIFADYGNFNLGFGVIGLAYQGLPFLLLPNFQRQRLPLHRLGPFPF